MSLSVLVSALHFKGSSPTVPEPLLILPVSALVLGRAGSPYPGSPRKLVSRHICFNPLPTTKTQEIALVISQ